MLPKLWNTSSKNYLLGSNIYKVVLKMVEPRVVNPTPAAAIMGVHAT